MSNNTYKEFTDNDWFWEYVEVYEERSPLHEPEQRTIIEASMDIND